MPNPDRSSENPSRAAIFGCAGPRLSTLEYDFFCDSDPAGFILFARNVENPDQIRGLVSDLRDSVGWTAPVLIDQEGGRVQRLRPPQWRAAPCGAQIGRVAAHNLALAERAAWLNARLIAFELNGLGIDVDCTPVLDNPVAGAHDVIGDRAYGTDPVLIARLGRAVIDGLMAGGVLPVIKHMPGHGRAGVDSHEACPVVTASDSDLDMADLPPFRALADAPFAMTAHVIYTAWDEAAVATLSPIVIEQIIRRRIGFDQVLMSDDLSMQALQGSLADRARLAQQAGCDLMLHCNGRMDEMVEVASSVTKLDGPALSRFNRALSLRKPPEPIEFNDLLNELDAILQVGGGA